MRDNQQGSTVLADLVDLVVQIRRDAGRTEMELHRRDRALLATGTTDLHDRSRVVRLWVDKLRSRGEALPGRQAQRLYRLQLVFLVLLGLLAGWGAAAAVFAYDGSRPVNVVHALMVFVGLQAVLLLGLGVVLVPTRLSRRLPFLAGFQDLLLWLSPGQWTRLTARLLPGRVRESMSRLFPFDDLRREPLGGVVKWCIVQSAQACGVAFYTGALVSALYLVAFSDLAFSWSTTLQADVGQVQRVTDTLSLPWARWIPAAVPSEELVRETQYYRQSGVRESGPNAEVEPARWGEWWPFLIAAMVTYGLIPRVGLLLVSTWRFGQAMRRGFVEAPGAALVWDRLTSHLVTTQAAQDEPDASTEPKMARDDESNPLPSVREFLLVNWGGVSLQDADLTAHVTQAWRAQVAMVLHAGGRASVEADAGVIEAVVKLPASMGVAVFLKGWEPPVLEALDFFQEIRAALGPQRLMVACPVGWDKAGRPVPPTEAQLQQWNKRLRSTGDRALVVRPWPGGFAE